MNNNPSSQMQNPHRFRSNHRLNNSGPKQTLTIKRTDLTSDVAFRIVCHFSVMEGLFGSSNAVVPTICRETNCRIHCDEGVPGSDHRVVNIFGPGSVDRTIVFCENDVREEFGEVSSTQEAVIRVFERVWEVEAQIEDETGGKGVSDVAYCGLLANTKQIGAVVGKRGKNVMGIREKSGAKIRMFPPPVCAAKDDELIQIMGGTLAVKKALVAVTSCLQSHPPIKKASTSLNGPVEMAHSSGPPDLHSDVFPQHLGNSASGASEFQLSPGDDGRDTCLDMKATQHEVAFRMLCSNKAAGGIIGKRGTVVRNLQNASGALITVAAPLTGSGKRVVTISALEDLDAWSSPAQNAVLLVFARSIEVDGQREFSSGSSKGANVTVRLLVGSDLVDCLTGNGGQVVSEMTDLTSAVIQILRGEQIMDFAAENDVVVQITGNQANVQNALFQVTSRLRHNLLYGKVVNGMRVMSPNKKIQESRPPGLHQSVVTSPASQQETNSTRVDQFGPPSARPKHRQAGGRGTAATYGEQGSRSFGGSLELEKSPDYRPPTKLLNEMGAGRPSGRAAETTSSVLHQLLGQSLDCSQQNNQLGLFEDIGCPSKLLPPKTDGGGHAMTITNGEGGSTAFAGGVGFQSGNKSVFVANITIEIIVAEHIFGSVYGEDGGNLARLKQISGAKVEVRNPCPGKSEGMIIISGTPEETQVAQSLLQAYVLVGQ